MRYSLANHQKKIVIILVVVGQIVACKPYILVSYIVPLSFDAHTQMNHLRYSDNRGIELKFTHRDEHNNTSPILNRMLCNCYVLAGVSSSSV